MKTFAKLVNNGLEAVDAIQDLHRQGYGEREIYVLTHDKLRTEHLADVADANTVGVSEEGVVDTVANLFRSRGDELRNKIESMGFDSNAAQWYESELDRGKVLVIARN